MLIAAPPHLQEPTPIPHQGAEKRTDVTLALKHDNIHGLAHISRLASAESAFTRYSQTSVACN